MARRLLTDALGYLVRSLASPLLIVFVQSHRISLNFVVPILLCFRLFRNDLSNQISKQISKQLSKPIISCFRWPGCSWHCAKMDVTGREAAPHKRLRSQATESNTTLAPHRRLRSHATESNMTLATQACGCNIDRVYHSHHL